MYVKRNFEAQSRNHCCNGKAVSKIYSECVCVGGGGWCLRAHWRARVLTRVLPYPARKAHAPYYTVVCPSPTNVSTLSHK